MDAGARDNDYRFSVRDASTGVLGAEAAQLLLAQVDNMVCALDLSGRFTFVNGAGERLTGYSAAELLGRPAAALIAPHRRADAVERFERRLAGAGVEDLDETILVTRTGRHVAIEVSSTVFRTDGEPAGVLGIVHDLTERRRAETALEHSERRFASLLEAAPDGVVIVDRRGEIVLVNARTEELFGYDRSELVGRSVDMLLPEALSDGHAEHRLRFVEDAHMREMGSGLDLIARRKDGHEFPVDINLSPLETATGLLVVASVRDVTERKRAENALLESERRFRRSFSSAAIGMALVAPEGRFLEVNDSLCAIVGYPREQLLSLSFQDITHPDDLELDLGHLRRVMKGELRSYQLEKRYLHRDGSVVWVLLSVALITDNDGRPIHFVSQIQNITARKHAQQALELSEAQLAEAERRYRTLVEQLPLGTYVRPLDLGRPNIYASPQVEPLLGYPASEWERDAGLLARIVHPDDRERVLSAARHVRETGVPLKDEYRYIAADGRTVWVQDETYLVRNEHGEEFVQGFLLDITERKQAEIERDRLRDELHHAQKLDAVGRLAGGIAHDFNNMLTAIRGYAELLVDRLEQGAGRDEALQIKRAAEQAATLPQKLLAFGRKQSLQPQTVNLNDIVRATSDLLRHLLTEVVTVVAEPCARHARAHVDPSQIEHVLVNLALNARDAMPSGGTLRIATSEVEVAAPLAREHAVTPGRYAVLSVSDTGVGMDATTRERIFEPFFTTKPHGQGSGLGLASVYGTVSQSGGFVRVRTAPGEGTTFDIHLPCPTDPAAAGSGSAARPTILLAEDEEVVRALTAEVLDRAGFDVVAAADGAEALRLYGEIGEGISALVTDLVMPTVGGRELAGEVRRRDPSLPIVFMSGYSDDPLDPEADLADDVAFLQKPFSPKALVATVSALASSPAAVPEPSEAAPLLTRRELEVVRLVADGFTTEKAAATLAISPETVQSHVRNAMRKLGAESRTEVVAKALRLSLIA
jgi:PAS domain S-box-containing protein